MSQSEEGNEPQQPERPSYHERIAVALERIAGCMEANSAPVAEPSPVMVNESMGSCPNCESFEEIEQRGKYPQAIYRCGKCETIWVNDANAVFEGPE